MNALFMDADVRHACIQCEENRALYTGCLTCFASIVDINGLPALHDDRSSPFKMY